MGQKILLTVDFFHDTKAKTPKKEMSVDQFLKGNFSSGYYYWWFYYAVVCPPPGS